MIMVLVATLSKNILSQSRILMILFVFQLYVVTCKDDAPPCFAIISPRTFHMIEPQYKMINRLFIRILGECNTWNLNPNPNNNLTTVIAKTKRMNENDEIVCLHLSIRSTILTHQTIELTGATEGRRLVRKYHAILRHYVFPFEPFVPHTHWSPRYNNCPFPDKGLIIDDLYYCKHDHINILPWQHVNHMSEVMLIKYIIIMDQIIDHQFVRQHYRINHSDPLSFFVGHRHYIACVEQELSRHGVPLPYWSPESTIPPLLQGIKRSSIGCFSSKLCIEGWLDLPIYSTNVSLSKPKQFHPKTICQFRTLESLHTLTLGWHGAVHRAIGGSFTFYESAAALLFFPFHNYIDKIIYKYWEENC